MNFREVTSFFSHLLVWLGLPVLALTGMLVLGGADAAPGKAAGGADGKSPMTFGQSASQGSLRVGGEVYQWKTELPQHAGDPVGLELRESDGALLFHRTYTVQELLPGFEEDVWIQSLKVDRFISGHDLLHLELAGYSDGWPLPPQSIWLTPSGYLRYWPGTFLDYRAEGELLLTSVGLWEGREKRSQFTQNKYRNGKFIRNFILLEESLGAGMRLWIRDLQGENLHNLALTSFELNDLQELEGKSTYLLFPDPGSNSLSVLDVNRPESLKRFPLGGLEIRSQIPNGLTPVSFGKDRQLLLGQEGNPVAWLNSNGLIQADY